MLIPNESLEHKYDRNSSEVLIEVRFFIKKLVVLTLILFISCIFVVFTVFFDGKMINTYEELEESFPMAIGFPIEFVELTWVKIDPPLPYFYGISCCGSTWHFDKFLLSVLIVFLFLSLIYLVSYFVIVNGKSKNSLE